MVTSTALLALTAIMATGPAQPMPAMAAVEDEPAPTDSTLTTPTAMIAPQLIRFELREGLVPGLTLALVNRLQATGGVTLPVFKVAGLLFGLLKLRLFTLGPLTFTAAAGRVNYKVSNDFEGKLTGGSLLAAYCFRADCRTLASMGLWYGERSEVEDTSPYAYRGWFGTVSLIVATGTNSAFLADSWFGKDTAFFSAGMRWHWRGFFADLGFGFAELMLPWLNLGYGLDIRLPPIAPIGHIPP